MNTIAQHSGYRFVPCDQCFSGWIGGDLCGKCEGTAQVLVTVDDGLPKLRRAYAKSLSVFLGMLASVVAAWFGIVWLFLRALGVW